MPFRSHGELITVSNPLFTAVHKSFEQNRERLRSEHKYPVILGHVDGLNENFQFQRSQSAYFVFDVSRIGLRSKENVTNFLETKNSCLVKKMFS